MFDLIWNKLSLKIKIIIGIIVIPLALILSVGFNHGMFDKDIDSNNITKLIVKTKNGKTTYEAITKDNKMIILSQSEFNKLVNEGKEVIK